MLDTSTRLDSIIYAVIEGICFGIKDGYEAVHLVSDKSKDIYLIGGGSKSDFWGDMISFTLNQNILVGKDSDQGAALGVARLAMLATKEYKKSEVVKNMKTVRECFPSKIKSDQLQERYKTWKKIVNSNVVLFFLEI